MITDTNPAVLARRAFDAEVASWRLMILGQLLPDDGEFREWSMLDPGRRARWRARYRANLNDSTKG
jgi:hypothetical protein